MAAYIHERPDEAGFTLLETLIAFLVLSLSLGVFVQSVSLATLQIRSAETLRGAERLGVALLSGAHAGAPSDGVDAETGLYWRRHQNIFLPAGGNDKSVKFGLVTVEIRKSPGDRALFVLKTVQAMESQP